MEKLMNLKKFTVLIFLYACLTSGAVMAQLVSFIDSTESVLANSIQLESDLIQKSAVRISLEELETLGIGDIIEFATSTNQAFHYEFDSRSEFLNGDTSWSASFREID